MPTNLKISAFYTNFPQKFGDFAYKVTATSNFLNSVGGIAKWFSDGEPEYILLGFRVEPEMTESYLTNCLLGIDML